MEHQQIKPQKITKPIQLLASWLVGLVLVNGSFLGTAATIQPPNWISAVLVVAAVVNVPLFLVCIFLLQTKFRPEMQEDSYYSKYLEVSTGKIIHTSTQGASVEHLRQEITSTNARYLSLLENVEKGVMGLAGQISSIVKSSNLEKSEMDKILTLENEITKSRDSIKRARHKVLREAKGILINDLLPEYHDIRKELNNAGLKISGTFGTSSDEPEVPKKKILGFNDGSEMSVLQGVWKILKNKGFNLIHHGLGDDRNRIYIGSYVYKYLDGKEIEGRPVLINDEIEAILESPESSLEDLINIIEKNARSEYIK